MKSVEKIFLFGTVVLMYESLILMIHAQGGSSSPSTSVPEPGSDSGFSKGVHEFATIKDCAQNCKSGNVQGQDYVECVPKAHVYENYPGFDLICKCRLYFHINRKNCRPIDQPNGGDTSQTQDQGGDSNSDSNEVTTEVGEDESNTASTDLGACRQTLIAFLVLGSLLGARLDHHPFLSTFLLI